MAELSVIGKSVPRVDALEKVTGKAKYNSDFKPSHMLYAKVLRSLYPHARVLRIDTSKAKKLPGVKAVLTGKDIPDKRLGWLIRDQYPLARDVVRYVGEPVAAVAADTLTTAEDALELIDVEYEALSAVFDPEEAMKTDPPVVVHPELQKYESIVLLGIKASPPLDRPNVLNVWKIQEGDVEKGFKEADLIVENRFYCPRVQHSQLEPDQADAWVEADGTLTVRGMKGIHNIKPALCYYFGLPPSKVRALESYLGGDFGGRTSSLICIVAALLAMKAGRPVRLVYTRAEVFIASGSREPIITYIKDGVKKDGTLVAREMKLIVEAGAYGEYAAIVTRNTCFGAVGTYRVPNFKVESYGVYTNSPKTRPHRGLGVSQPICAIEQQMDIMAEKLGIDPVEVRRRNILREGDRDVSGQVTHAIGARECLDKVAEAIEWGKPPEVPVGPWRRGKGIGLGNKYTAAAITSVSMVKVHPDGVIEARHGTDELGQGICTVVAQIAAEEFGTSVDKVKVVWGDTNITAYDWVAGSSRSTYHTGNALRLACQDAKRKLCELAALRLGVSAQALEVKGGKICARGWPGKELKISDLFSPVGYAVSAGEIIGIGTYSSPYVVEDENGQSARNVAYYAHGAYAVEVAVNVETGAVKVLKIAGAFDMGQPINPKMCEQQIDGGAVQGIAHALFEEQIMSSGTIVNPSFADYKMPTAGEVPSYRNVVTMMAPAPHREGPFGAKGVGEGTLTPMLAAVCNAVYNAVGIRIKELPITREKLWRALKGGDIKA